MKLVEQPSGQINAVTSQSKKPEVPWRRKRHGDKHATKECGRCGTLHDQTKRERCPAYGKTCLKCGKVSHLASKCRSKKRDPKSDNKDIPVRTVDSDNSESEVFYAEMISAVDLDPKDLNRAVQREHYPLPTIEDVATRLHGAKVFTKLDARNGFWHVALDDESSYLTTFHTPFGRYRWRRLPFGISSAPEVFQRRMHQLIEGLSGIEIVADDFIVIGCGNTVEEANSDHDRALISFLERCKEQGVKLNTEKLNLRLTGSPVYWTYRDRQGLACRPRQSSGYQRNASANR